MTTTALTKGTKVGIQRDETQHPSRGTWPQFRGRTGTINDINAAGGGATEYGIGFGKSRSCDAWFKAHELQPL
ncbi:hypothetical protein ABQF35_14395 [Mycobacterium syngnathidarum]